MGLDINPVWKHFISGGVSAAVAETMLAPMERVKIILQVQHVNKQIPKEKLYTGVVNTFVRTAKEHGLLSFWRGNLTNVVRYIPLQALSFTFKPFYKSYLLEGVNQNTQFWRYFAGNLASGGAAGATSLSVVYPLDYVRTRLSADVGKGKDKLFNGIVDCIVKTVKSDGIVGLYRGYFVSIQGIFVYRAIYFGCFDTAMNLLPYRKETPMFITWIVAHAVTVLAGVISYPMDTVRRLMMMQSGVPKDKRVYKNTTECWSKIIKTDGVRALYRGVVASFFSCMSGSVVLVIYPVIKKFL